MVERQDTTQYPVLVTSENGKEILSIDQTEEIAGATDEQLVTLLNQWDRESESVYSVLRGVWLENILYYNGVQTEVQNIRGRRSKAVENRLFMAIETIIPIATARLPEVEVRPPADVQDEQALLDAQTTQDILSYHFENTRFQGKAEEWVRDMLVKRYGVFKVLWDKEKDDVDILRIDSRRIRIPKYGQTVRELAYVMEDLELQYETMVEMFGTAEADKIVTTAPGRLNVGNMLVDDISGYNRRMQVRPTTYTVTEIWTNDYRIYRVPKQDYIVKKDRNPLYDFKNKKKNFFDKPSKPYVIEGLFATDESLIADTDYIQQTKFLQDNLNNRRRQTEDILSRTANPNLLIDSDVMSEEQAANITNDPGQILYGKDAASGTKIRFEAPGAISPGLFTDMQETRSAIDNIIGTHSTTRGEREGRETATGRQLLREGDLGRIDLIGRKLERAIDEIAEWWLQMMKMFYTEEKSFAIAGREGIRYITGFTGERIGQVKPRVKIGSTLKEDQAAITQKGIVLWQSKAIGIRTLYKMLGLPNMQDAIDDFVETQSGAILQQGQAPGQVPGVLPPAGGEGQAPTGIEGII